MRGFVNSVVLFTGRDWHDWAEGVVDVNVQIVQGRKVGRSIALKASELIFYFVAERRRGLRAVLHWNIDGIERIGEVLAAVHADRRGVGCLELWVELAGRWKVLLDAVLDGANIRKSYRVDRSC